MFTIEYSYLRALLYSWLEGKLFFLVVNVEIDLASSHIYACIGGAQEWPPQYERSLHVNLHVEEHEIHGNKEIPNFLSKRLVRFPQGNRQIGPQAANT